MKKRTTHTDYLSDLDYDLPRRNIIQGSKQEKCKHYEDMLYRRNLTLDILESEIIYHESNKQKRSIPGGAYETLANDDAFLIL